MPISMSFPLSFFTSHFIPFLNESFKYNPPQAANSFGGVFMSNLDLWHTVSVSKSEEPRVVIQKIVSYKCCSDSSLLLTILDCAGQDEVS